MMTPSPGEAVRGAANGSDSVSSLRYQALSRDSYRLDSPPFTGAAVEGEGPVTRGLDPGHASTENDARDAGRGKRADGDVPSWKLEGAHRSVPGELDDELDEYEEPLSTDSHRSPYAHPVPRQGESLVGCAGSHQESYAFPRHRLPQHMLDESKTPLVVVACGSFSPPTYLHLYVAI